VPTPKKKVSTVKPNLDLAREPLMYLELANTDFYFQRQKKKLATPDHNM
jgi:hypothetical protein